MDSAKFNSMAPNYLHVLVFHHNTRRRHRFKDISSVEQPLSWTKRFICALLCLLFAILFGGFYISTFSALIPTENKPDSIPARSVRTERKSMQVEFLKIEKIGFVYSR